MSFIDGILSALGIGGGSLNHIKAMAHSVKPGEIDRMAQLFDQGSQVFNTGHTGLESAIDNVVTGWKGEAAAAASTSVLNSAMTSRSGAEASLSAADNVRQFAATVRDSQQKIAAVQPVDTSFSTAMHKAGGPAALVLNPGAVAANMAAAEIQSEQHREQAAQYLDQMNAAGDRFAASQAQVYPQPPSRAGATTTSALPSRLSVQPIASGGGASMPGVPAGPGGSSTAPWSAPTGPGGPSSVGTISGPHGGGPAAGPGGGHPGAGNPTGPVHVVAPPPGDTTTLQGTGPTSGTTGTTPVALPDPVGGGSGGGLGASTVAVIGGGAAAIAAGGLSGLTRGGVPAGATAGGAGVEGDRVPGVRGGAGAGGEEPLGERGFARGSGFASGPAADEAAGRLRPGLGNGVGGFDPAEESPLRAGRMSAASGELAAGERGGLMPGMGTGAGRRGDDEELDKRPDYLVETDDVWGDGRLAAPPVLG